MHSSTHLIARANGFLDCVSANDSAVKLQQNIETLTVLKEEMMFQGFDAPYSGLLNRTRLEIEEFTQADSRDLKKQVEKIRGLVNAKKFSLSRVRIALVAHKIALGVLESRLRKELVKQLPLDGNYIGKLINARECGLFAYKRLMDVLGEESEEGAKGIAVTVEYEK
ncbi:MAG: DUF530 family protein, partial [Candidatus Micrarchaeota archaeon]